MGQLHSRTCTAPHRDLHPRARLRELRRAPPRGVAVPVQRGVRCVRGVVKLVVAYAFIQKLHLMKKAQRLGNQEITFQLEDVSPPPGGFKAMGQLAGLKLHTPPTSV
jgi:hypothetical protein